MPMITVETTSGSLSPEKASSTPGYSPPESTPASRDREGPSVLRYLRAEPEVAGPEDKRG